MRYIKFYGGTAYCGECYEYFMEFSDDITDSMLDRISNEYIANNASLYFESQLDPDDYKSEEDYQLALDNEEDEYFTESWGTWEAISKKEFEGESEDEW